MTKAQQRDQWNNAERIIPGRGFFFPNTLYGRVVLVIVDEPRDTNGGRPLLGNTNWVLVANDTNARLINNEKSTFESVCFSNVLFTVPARTYQIANDIWFVNHSARRILIQTQNANGAYLTPNTLGHSTLDGLGIVANAGSFRNDIFFQVVCR